MIVNGVTLPDIPEDVLAEFPYAVITKETHVFTDTNEVISFYTFFASAGRYAAIPPGMPSYATDGDAEDHYRLAWTEKNGKHGIWGEGDDGWTVNIEYDFAAQPLDLTRDLSDLGIEGYQEYHIVWANHDLSIVTEMDYENNLAAKVGTEIYFPNSEAPKPTRVSIGRSLVDGYAKQVQRLTGTTDQMNAVQIREKLSTVKASIKIGDTVLPPIPEEYMDGKPYVCILKEMTNGYYVIRPSATPYFTDYTNYDDGGLIWLRSDDTEKTEMYGYDESSGAWIYGDTVNAFLLSDDSGSYFDVMWSNHDIHDGSASAEGIYFSEFQNFNGVWLPKIPEDVLEEYPYAMVLKCETNNLGTVYRLFVAKNFIAYLIPELFGSEYVASMASGGYRLRMEGMGIWGAWNEFAEGEATIPIGESNLDYDDYTKVTVVWANHDIDVITSLDLTTGEYTTGGLYFPPLPAIDSDRISIGYDLCDGIVKEIQRLSDSTDKMNALRAYWKLTTVVGMAAPSGGIVIDGMTLPEIPADVLASYPYCSILGMNGQYMLIGTQSKQVVGLGSGSGNGSYENDYIRPTESSGYVMYGYGGEFTAWTLQNQSDDFGALELMTPIPFVWANHDLYTWVYSTSENEWVMDEIYFPSSI